MKNIVVAGLINIETTVAIDGFPIEYSPIDYRFFGVETTVSGVGYNLAKALKTLGDNVDVLSLIGDDIHKSAIKNEFQSAGINTDYLKTDLADTPQSVILYDKDGRRKINLDLKDIQDKNYPAEQVEELIKEADIVVPCNINFARSVLRLAKKYNKTIASDVHVVSDIEDEYNKEFMEASDILFLSNENILGQERQFVEKLVSRYNNQIIVVGMGKKGSLLYVRKDDRFVECPAVDTRKIVSTIGAGDALFSAFVHFYGKTEDPYKAIEMATIFASYKIGEKGAASGFLTEQELVEIAEKIKG